jgi:hypothetical protein
MTQLLFTVLLIAICPLMMFFMMRGMSSGGRRDDMRSQPPAPSLIDSSTQEARIADLESEVARLSTAQPDVTSPAALAAVDLREHDAFATPSWR